MLFLFLFWSILKLKLNINYKFPISLHSLNMWNLEILVQLFIHFYYRKFCTLWHRFFYRKLYFSIFAAGLFNYKYSFYFQWNSPAVTANISWILNTWQWSKIGGVEFHISEISNIYRAHNLAYARKYYSNLNVNAHKIRKS